MNTPIEQLSTQTHDRVDVNAPWLLLMLKFLRSRPGMYLGHESTRLLQEYLYGYCQARQDLGVSTFGLGEPDHLVEFREWLRIRHGYSETSTFGWVDAIERLDGSERNIGTFYSEFESYLSERHRIDLMSVPGSPPFRWVPQGRAS